MNNPFETLVDSQKINEVIENTLLITLNPEKKGLFLVNNDESKIFSTDLLEFSLFERIIAFDSNNTSDEKVIVYLYESYKRVIQEHQINRNSNDIIKVLNSIENLIFRNVSTILKQPELVTSQDLSRQFIDIFRDECDIDGHREKFLQLTICSALKDCDEDMRRNVLEVFFKSFDIILKVVKQATMITLEKWIFPYLMAFVSDKNNPEAANIFLDYIKLPENSEGIKYSSTLLGQLLSISITPKNNNGPYEYYDNLNNTNLVALNNLSSSLWNYLNVLNESLYNLIKYILVIGGETRDKILYWIGNAISSNTKRGQIWNQHSSMILGNYTTAPDSFMVRNFIRKTHFKHLFSTNSHK